MGPVQFLSRLPGAVVHVAAASLDPVPTDCNVALVPNVTFTDCPQADIICVPGGHGVREALHDGATVAFIAAQAPAARWVMASAICSPVRNATKMGAAEFRLPLRYRSLIPPRMCGSWRSLTAGPSSSSE
ncbi:MAG: DJ-1/PfpI family protein, partial [Sphingopyxis sp.]|nr:DJ-1/PfpI family protein [Sphingopyxis sp.]